MRRIPILVLVLIALAAAVIADRQRPPEARATFSVAAAGWMPTAPAPGGLTETWFCPGLPASGRDGIGGSLVISNRIDAARPAVVVLYNERGESRRIDFDLQPWAMSTIDIDATLPGEMVAALVEVDGGGALVEQHSEHPRGNSSTACANSTSSTWFLADGFTVEQSVDQIVLSNPFEQTVVAELVFATREGPRAPGAYSGITIEPRSTRVIDLGAPGAGAQGEPILAVTVNTRRGRLVVGRVQHFLGGGRTGTNVTLAVPAPRSQWWFAGGQKGAGISERYSIYNASDDDVEVDMIFIGIPTAIEVDPITVPANEVVVFEPAAVLNLLDGRYALVFSTLNPALVVERATTTVTDDQAATSVIAGAPPRQDGYLATRWFVPVAPAAATSEGLVIYNADNEVGTLTVSAIGASGPVPVPGLVDVDVPRLDQVLTIDLSDPIVLGRTLVIESTNRIFVERSVPTGRGDLRSATWAVPSAT